MSAPIERLCGIEACGRPWVAKGLCLKHYKAARRTCCALREARRERRAS